MSWLNHLGNMHVHQIKKTIFELIQERYPQNEQIIERVAAALTTEKDVKDFFKLVSDIYEMAYLKSVKDHREALEKMGLAVSVRAEK
jgi:hypothetical protein